MDKDLVVAVIKSLLVGLVVLGLVFCVIAFYPRLLLGALCALVILGGALLVGASLLGYMPDDLPW